MSYIGDYPEDDHLCRIYGYTLPESDAVAPRSDLEITWLTAEQISRSSDAAGYETARDAFPRWLDPHIVRGIGKSRARSEKNQFE